MMETMMSKERLYGIASIVVTLISFWMLTRHALPNRTISGNLADSRIAGQEAIYTVLSLENKAMPVTPAGSSTFCKNEADPTLSCRDFILTMCSGYPCLLPNDAIYTDDVWKIPDGKGLFFRKIRITATDRGAKKITVFIWWYDAAGFHNSPISRIVPYQP